MRTRNLVLFLTGTVPYWFLSRVVFCYDEAPWQPIQYDYYHIDLGELAGNQDQGFASRSSKLPTPSDAIVDVINNLGIKLLAIHNERNENNIAISPYGAFSVLAALSEGLQGESVHEILHAAHVPYDQQTVRVGLRDIHRHLKSYFIPDEGFLAGLTLNLNNITLKSDYQDVLKFYGFDYGSFNNALYPDPPTTKKSTEGTTLETGLGVLEDDSSSAATTTEPPQNTIVEVVNRASDDIPMTTEIATTNTPTITVASVEITTSAPEETTTEAAKSTEAVAISPEGTSTLPSVETAPPTEPPEDTTTATAVIETLELNAAKQTPLGTSKDTTLARVTSVTSSNAAKIPGGYTSTKQFETTAEYHHTTSSDSETASSNSGTSSVTSSVGSTGNTVRTTREVTESIQSSIGQTTMILTSSMAPTTNSYSTESTELQQTTTETPKSTSVQTVEAEATAKPQFTKQVVTTETTLMPDTTTQLSPTSETVSSAETIESTSELTSLRSTQTVLSPGTTAETTFTSNTPMNTQPGITGTETTSEPTSSSLTTLTTIGQSENSVSTQEDNLETTTPLFFGTTPNFQGTPANQGNFDFNNYNYNENTPVYDDEEVVENADNNNFKRSVRSVADYIISRYLCRICNDGSQFVPLTQRTQYVPEDSMTFAVYGKYREPVAFMKYDTVLPYFFAPNLNAVALSFPLDSSKYYLLLLLPLRDDGVDQLIYDLRISGSLKYVIENLRLAHVQATIPSFTLKGYVTLTPTLQKLGIRQIFEPRQADFSPMTNSTDIFVTNIEQAVTVTIRNYLDPSAQRYKNYQQYPPITFKADHPFLYFVVDSQLHVALMVGKVINPLNSRIS
ncbi:uncharacterized protein [Euwallacea fornicatus]|uniref:uncharacterized protein isoform X2 n=1 Tax=Euwallacea fornicatus TaxID=995702 RepID=UPI00338E729F